MGHSWQCSRYICGAIHVYNAICNTYKRAWLWEGASSVLRVLSVISLNFVSDTHGVGTRVIAMCLYAVCAVVLAEINADFHGVRQNLTFFPDETLRTKKCITIETIEDSVYEGVEQYGLHIRLDYQFTQVNSPARLYIRENDGKRKRKRGRRGEGGREREGRGGREGGGREGRDQAVVCGHYHNVIVSVLL